jgi:DNA-binding transcriptional ArsR family regulator
MIHIRPSDLDPERLRRQAGLLGALASPARIAILRALSLREMSVNEIVDMLAGLGCPCSVERTNVSKHLAVLRENGIVTCTGEAQKRIYRLEARCVLEAIDCVVERRCSSEYGSEKGERHE